MSNPNNDLVFDNFCVDRRQGILLRNNKHVPLAPKAYEILLVLIENRDRIVSKDELMERVWPDTTVEESNIAKNISQLRRILGADKEETGKEKPDQENSKYIATISKRGYRFIHEVQEVAANVPVVKVQAPSITAVAPALTVQADALVRKNEFSFSAPSIPTISALPRKRSRIPRRLILLFAGLAIVGVIGAIITAFVLKKESKNIDPTKIRHELITSWKTELGADLLMGKVSPDGKFLAYSKNETGQADIYIRQLPGAHSLAITQDEWPDHSPIWSPDSRQVAYLSLRSNSNELWISPLLGEKGKMFHQFESADAQLLHWSKNGKKIFYVTSNDLFSLDLNSGQRIQLTHFEETARTEGDFDLSPDEKSIAYTTRVNKAFHIFVVAIGGGTPKQLTSEGEMNISPVWFEDGKRILYASKRGDSYQLYVAYLDGRPPVQLMSNSDNTMPVDVTPDGKTVVYRILREEADIYRVDAELGNETPIASEGLLDIFPAVSPDGKAIAFQQASNREMVTYSNILVQSLSAKNSVLGRIENGFDVRWLGADRLAFLRDVGGLSALWTVRSDGADARQLTREAVASNGFSTQPYGWRQPFNYSWSPKNGLLAFSALKSKVLNIWTVPATGGAEKMISNNADPDTKLVSPIWSPDGMRLVYLAQPSAIGKAPRRIVLYEQTPEGGKEQTLVQTESRLRMLGWSEDGTKFLFGEVTQDSSAAMVNLELKQIALGQTDAVRIGKLDGIYFNSPLLSPDGKSVVYIARQSNRDNLWRLSLADRRAKQLTNNTETLLHLTAPAWSPDEKSIYYTTQSTRTEIRSLTNFD